MKRLIVSMVLVAMVFVGIGSIAEKVAASFKSDEKAMTIIKNARLAIGGDAAIAEVKSMVIKGQTRRTLRVNGVERIEQGETEIVFESPNRLMKMVKIGNGDGSGGDPVTVERNVDVVVVGRGEGVEKTMIVEGRNGDLVTENGAILIAPRIEGAPGVAKIIVKQNGENDNVVVTSKSDVKEVAIADGKRITMVRKGDGPEWTADGGKSVVLDRAVVDDNGHPRDNELLRTTLSLLLTAPEGIDVAYTFGGETNVDGIAANVVNAAFDGATVKLFFDRTTNLPLGMSYAGHAGPMVIKMKRIEGQPVVADEKKDVVFTRTIRDTDPDVATFVRFTDYRTTNGVQLPYQWTTSVAGKQAEVFEVATYDLNPADISERFKFEDVRVRVKAETRQN